MTQIMNSNFMFVYMIIILCILVSIQYTLNKILKTLNEIKNRRPGTNDDFNKNNDLK